MRALGLLGFALGSAGVAYAVWAMFHKHRPVDVAFSLLAPVCAVIALIGLLLTVAPDAWP